MRVPDISDCFIIKVAWTACAIGVHSTPDCSLFAVKFLLLNHSWVFCARNSSVLSVYNPKTLETKYSEKTSYVETRNRSTCFLYKIEKSQLVEHDLVVVTSVLFLSCMKTCGADVPGCSDWCSREFVDLQMIP